MAQVIDAKGKAVREVSTPAAFSGSVDGKANAIFRAVFRELANRRAGTADTKKRDEVRGGGRKPWKQKGTGRARQGSIRSPQWAHGGVVFGPHPRTYVSSLNKKERRAAMVAALTDKFRSGGVTVLDTAAFDVTKTKALATLLFGSPNAAKTGATSLVVFATEELASVGTPLRRAGRNLQRVAVTHTGELDVKDVVACARLVLTTSAFDALAGKFAAQETR
jgi:large subunit ribosomal protein L4